MKKINKKAIPFQKYSTHGDSVIFRLLKLKNKLEEKLLENKYIIGMTAKVIDLIIINFLLFLNSNSNIIKTGNDSNLLIVFYVQIMPDDFVMQLHRF